MITCIIIGDCQIQQRACQILSPTFLINKNFLNTFSEYIDLLLAFTYPYIYIICTSSTYSTFDFRKETILLRNRIIQAFIEEAHQNSIRFTMDDLASNLATSKRTIYKHFSSKNEILDEIIEMSFNEIKQKEEVILENKELATLEKIKYVLIIVPNFFDLYDQKILNQMKKYYPEQWEKVMFELNNTWNSLRDLLEQGINEGVIKSYSLPIIMKLISNGTNWFLDQKYLNTNDINIVEAFTVAADILLFGLVVEDDESRKNVNNELVNEVNALMK